MLNVHHGNQLESLLSALAEVLGSSASESPQNLFLAQSVVVQNQGMARWVAHQLAERLGIAANVEFPLPATFIWGLFESQFGGLQKQSPFDRDVLIWRLYRLLPELLDEPEFGPVQRYLARRKENDSRRLFQLCGRIADLFDQYLVYRPEMILGWEREARQIDIVPDAIQGDLFAAEPKSISDDPAIWQERLWLALLADMAGESGVDHRARLWQRFACLESVDPEGLPSQICLFGLTGLAPVYMDVLGKVAEAVDVHVFLLNPSQEYWVDIAADKGQARRRALWRQNGAEDLTPLLEVGNPLLASMGHVGQVFVDQLLKLEAKDSKRVDAEYFVDPGRSDEFEPTGDEDHAGSLLHQLQSDVLNLADRRTPIEEDRLVLPDEDESLQVHLCHSPLREVQVLRDRLLNLFETLPGLEPRDIVVMAPAIEAYAPYIEAIFSDQGRDRRRYVPWSIADLGQVVQSPLMGSLRQLLRLPESRFEASEILKLLETPAIATRFGLELDSPDSLDRLRQWLEESGVRWGLDADMRETLGCARDRANTWDAGLAALFAGYALPADSPVFEDSGEELIAPYADMEGHSARDLGRLQAFVETLDQWRERLERVRNPEAWVRTLNQLIDVFVAEDLEEADQGRVQQMREHLADWLEQTERAGLNQDLNLPLEVVRDHLEARLEEETDQRRFLAGGVTFCNMVPMRSIPFRVVCLLGLNDGDFPRDQRAPAFDLMAQHPRATDRSRRRDDRYLFLEALLSARDALHLSYQGRDVRENRQREPSVLLQELMDYCEKSYRWAGGEKDTGFLERVRVEHPLQPFSPRYFHAAQSTLYSYDPHWAAVAQQGQTPVDAIPGFRQQDLPEPDSPLETLELDALIAFLLEPARTFLRERLGVVLPYEQVAGEDVEPFALDALDRYQLQSEALALLLSRPESVGLASAERGVQDDLFSGRVATDLTDISEPGPANEFAPTESEDPLMGLHDEWRAKGRLPQGESGDQVFQAATRDLPDLARRAREQAADREPVEVDLRLDGVQLTGWIRDLGKDGCLSVRSAKLKAKDCLRLWVKHLALCASVAGSEEDHVLESQHVHPDGVLRFGGRGNAWARAQLTELVRLYREGSQRPVDFFCATSLAWAEGLQKDEHTAWKTAEKAWGGDYGEQHDAYLTLVLRGREPEQIFAGDEFQTLAKQVYQPMLDAVLGDEE